MRKTHVVTLNSTWAEAGALVAYKTLQHHDVS